ncbi:MAG: hypothetical protein KY468_21425 [Armatimonadetes bacterium]|nr:hypothetical protein [Armatimonadota bacterium]
MKTSKRIPSQRLPDAGIHVRRILHSTVAFLLIGLSRMTAAHPHRPEENVPPHIHEVTGRQVFEGPWAVPLAILVMLVVFVGLPCLVIWSLMQLYQRLPWNARNR